jgi:undecaprenyl-diphosphatase
MIESIFLGVIQGITEFLPISSSGHLVLFSHWLGRMENKVLFDVMLHVGTLFSIVIIFRKELLKLSGGIIRSETLQIRKGLYILTATVPTAIIGLVGQDFFENLFLEPSYVAGAMLFTGTLLFTTLFFSHESNPRSMNLAITFLIGIMQGIAIVPGISRAGTTIATALLLGTSRKEAGEFSFIISIPVITGAAILKVREYLAGGSHEVFNLELFAGMIAAFLAGIMALKILLSFVQSGHLHHFAWYLWLVGFTGMILL